jgi:hypothetical protein
MFHLGWSMCRVPDAEFGKYMRAAVDLVARHRQEGEGQTLSFIVDMVDTYGFLAE